MPRPLSLRTLFSLSSLLLSALQTLGFGSQFPHLDSLLNGILPNTIVPRAVCGLALSFRPTQYIGNGPIDTLAHIYDERAVRTLSYRRVASG